MHELTPLSAIDAGGWDTRYAVTLAVAVEGQLAAALIDTNGDGADIDLDEYERAASGDWQGGGSGSAGDSGASWSPRMVATWGRGSPHEEIAIRYRDGHRTVTATARGWRLCIMPTEDEDSYPVQVRRTT